MVDLDALFGWIAWHTLELMYLMVIVGTIIVVLLDNRNPFKTIAWVLVLIFLPFVGLVLYVFFGQDLHRMRIISRNGYNKLTKKPWNEYVLQKAVTEAENYSHLVTLLRNTNQSLLFSENDVEVYTTGHDFVESLVHQLEMARHHIHLEFYIFMDDAVGSRVREVLMKKAKEGVEVRVIYDDLGCWHVKKEFFEDMLGAGIEVRSFLKVRFPQFTSRVNYRNHRKIVVIDGKVGFVGGMNLADRYVDGVSWGIWKDMHLKLEGRAVYGLQTAFLLDWYFVDRSMITSSRYYPELEAKGEVAAQIVTSDPVGPWREIMQGMVCVISSARRYCYIQTPYFLPTEQVMAALQTAALSGTDIRLMLPERADSRLTQLGSYSYLAPVMRAGVKVYFYQKGFLHSKMIVSDDHFSTVGSTNLDFRSFEHNFEVNAFMYNQELALKIKEIFLTDMKDCQRLSLRDWEKRPWYQRAEESVIRLLAPLL